MFSEYKLSQIYPDLQIRKVFDIQDMNMSLQVLINNQYTSSMHANKQLVHSENCTLK